MESNKTRVRIIAQIMQKLPLFVAFALVDPERECRVLVAFRYGMSGLLLLRFLAVFGLFPAFRLLAADRFVAAFWFVAAFRFFAADGFVAAFRFFAAFRLFRAFGLHVAFGWLLLPFVPPLSAIPACRQA